MPGQKPSLSGDIVAVERFGAAWQTKRHHLRVEQGVE